MFLGAQIERKKERKEGKGNVRVFWSYSSTAVLPFKETSENCLLTLGTIFLSPEIIFPAGQDQSLALHTVLPDLTHERYLCL